MNKEFYKVKVSNLKRETEDTISLFFVLNEEQKKIFSHKPGQYTALRLLIDGEYYERYYSICSSENLDRWLKITIKDAHHSSVSTYINENIKVGDLLELREPDGEFYVDINENNEKTYYLFAAGSGITPLYSMLRTILYEELNSKVHLFYSNKNSSSIIFKDELNLLKSDFNNRFHIHHFLSDNKRLNEKAIIDIINKNKALDREAYLCGPEPYMELVFLALEKIEFPSDLIKTEYFRLKKA